MEEILSAAERTFTLYPEFEEISSHLYQYICSETSMNMFKGDDNTPSGILSLEGAALTTARTMECLHMFVSWYINTVNSKNIVKIGKKF